MLIRAIRAENFMRFERLDLSNLPRRGLIGIEGPNESGKSTIGEVLLFVFFGKTRTSSDASLSSLIRWGADSMSAEVEFTIAPPGDAERSEPDASKDYLIFRQIDRYGTNYVKVLELPERKEAASGCRQVAELLASRVKLDFVELQSSFFHDQHSERRTTSSQAAIFESASGLKHLRGAVDDLKRGLEPREREFGYLQKEIARNVVQAEKLDRTALKIPEVSQKVSKLAESILEKSRRASELKRRADLLRSDAGQLENRARRIEQLKDLSLEAFQQEIEKLASQGPPPTLRDLRNAEDEPLRGALGATQSGMESLRALSRDWRAFVDKTRSEDERAQGLLSPETPDGIEARLRDARRSRGRAEGRRARRSALTALGFAGATLLGAVSVLAYRGEVSAPPSWPEEWKSQFPAETAAAGGALLLAAGVALAARSKARGRVASLNQLTGELEAESGSIQAARKAHEPCLGVVTLKDLPQVLSAAATPNPPRSTSGSLVPGAVEKGAQELAAKHASFLAVGASAGGAESAPEKRLQALAKAERDLRARLNAEAQKTEKAAQDEDGAARKLAAEKERTDGELRECHSQAAKRDLLLGKNKELEEKSAVAREVIDLHLLACRLLDETIGSIRTKIGPALTRFTKRILPALTAGKYREVRVESGLEVKVFSSEKSDFLAIHELSGGTSEALHLALRLAVSHAFTLARTGQSQFVFLDEPFKMMDARRAVETLRLLPRLSAGLEQFFVAQPNFPPDARGLFDLRILTTQEGVRMEPHGEKGLVFEAAGGEETPLIARREGAEPTPYAVET